MPIGKFPVGQGRGSGLNASMSGLGEVYGWHERNAESAAFGREADIGGALRGTAFKAYSRAT
jgi:hypothetical protein